MPKVTFGTNLFVALSSADGSIYSSSDGINWTTRNSGESYALNAVSFANGSFVAVGGFTQGVGTEITTSQDGINWMASNSGVVTDNRYAIIYGDQGFVAPGNQFSHSNSIATSPDGITWTARGIDGDLDRKSVV